MATNIGLIQQVKFDASASATVYNLASTAYAECKTAANITEKEVRIDGLALIEGTTIHIKFANGNSASAPTLNINNQGAKSIAQYGEYNINWPENAIISFTYDKT